MVLELHELVISIAVGVVSCENLECFMVAVLGNKPSGRLGHPEQPNELDSREEALEKARDAPAPVVVHEKEPKRHDSRDNGSPEPDRLEEVGDVGAVFWVRDLRGQRWCCCLSETQAYTQHDTSSQEGIDAGGCALNDCCAQHKCRPNSHRDATAKVVRDV